MRWCIRSVFGTEVYQEAGRLLTFTCYITFICVLCMYFVCVCYAEWNFNYSHHLLSLVCFLCWQFLLSLTTLSLRAVDSSKVVGGLPREEMSEVFAQTWGQTFFEESRSRQTQQSFFHACSALPRSSYHNWATTTSHNHRKVTMAVFRIISPFFSRRRHCLTEGWCEQVCAIFHGHWLRGGGWLDGEGHTW